MSSYTDPFGLCVPINVCTAIIGAGVFGGIRFASNLINHRPWDENLGRDIGYGAVAGLTLGASTLVAGTILPEASYTAARAAPTAANASLQNTLRELYRVGDKIAGGTAGAIRHERETGELVGGVSHLRKGIERMANLQNIISRQKLSAGDLATARSELSNLKDAINGH